MALLRQSSSYNRVILLVGSADHVTGLAGATLTITASKNGGAFATITPTVTDRGSGFYSLALTTAHTDTLGDLALHITATSADPTDIVDQVIATDLTVANMPANVTQFGGVAGTFASGRPEVNTTHFGGTIAATPNTPGIPMVDGRQTIYSGALAAASATTVTLPAGASTVDNFYNDCFVIITGGTGNDQARAITGYVGSTKVATVDRAFATTPAAADTFIIYAFARTNMYAVAGTAQTARDLGAQLDATISSRMATFTLPTNFSSMSIDASGRVDVAKVAGTAQTARDLGASVLVSAGTGTGQLDITAGRIKADTVYWNASAVAAPNTAGVPVVDDRSSYIRAGTLQAATGSTATLDASASATDNIYNGNLITAANQTRRIVSYVGSTKVATLDSAWTSAPGAVAYTIEAFASVNVSHIAGTSQTARDLGAQLDATVSSRMATFTLPTNFSALAITAGGAVTAGTVSDKTGYSLSQAFPTNFASLAITAGGAVTAGTVSDKTGYSLTQTFPTNFGSLAITAGGATTVGTNTDKTGYSLAAGGQDLSDRSLIRKNTLQAGTGSTATLDTGASATDSFYNGLLIVVLTGTGAGQVRRITSYVGSTKVATVDSAWTTNPGAADFALLSLARVDVGAVSGTAQTARDLGAQLDATISSRMATFTLPTNFSALAVTAGGAVTAGTVSDKTGYSLTQTFPTNFGSLSIDVNGRVDVSKVLGTTQTARDLGAQLDATVSSRLAPTTAGRTLDVTTTGEAGIDWANIGGATTAQTLSGTTISTAQAVASVSGAVGSVTGAVGSVTAAVTVGTNNDKTGYSLAAGGQDLADRSLIRKNTLQAGTGSTATLDTGANATDDFYTNLFIVILTGTGAGQVRRIDSYVGSTKVATLGKAWTTNPGAADFALVAMSRVDVGAVAGTAQTARDLGANLDTTVSSRLATAGYTTPPTASAIADAVMNYVVENSRTFIQLSRGWTAALFGKASGLAGTTATYRDDADSKDRIVATVTADGDRTAVTKDLT